MTNPPCRALHWIVALLASTCTLAAANAYDALLRDADALVRLSCDRTDVPALGPDAVCYRLSWPLDPLEYVNAYAYIRFDGTWAMDDAGDYRRPFTLDGVPFTLFVRTVTEREHHLAIVPASGSGAADAGPATASLETATAPTETPPEPVGEVVGEPADEAVGEPVDEPVDEPGEEEPVGEPVAEPADEPIAAPDVAAEEDPARMAGAVTPSTVDETADLPAAGDPDDPSTWRADDDLVSAHDIASRLAFVLDGFTAACVGVPALDGREPACLYVEQEEVATRDAIDDVRKEQDSWAWSWSRPWQGGGRDMLVREYGPDFAVRPFVVVTEQLSDGATLIRIQELSLAE